MDNPFMNPATKLQTMLLFNLIGTLSRFGDLLMKSFMIQIDTLPNPLEVVMKNMTLSKAIDALCVSIMEYGDQSGDDLITSELFWKTAFAVQEEILPAVQELEHIDGYKCPELDGEPYSQVLSGWLATASN